MAKQLITKIDKAFLGRLCADAISNLERAIEKHPTFPGTFTDLDIEQSQELMYGLKSLNDNGLGDASTIAQEEHMELECSVTQGMPKQAYDELVDLITVWLRVGLHLDDYVSHRGTESTEVKP